MPEIFSATNRSQSSKPDPASSDASTNDAPEQEYSRQANQLSRLGSDENTQPEQVDNPKQETDSTEEEKLQGLIQDNQEVLCEISAVFPFDFFPSTIRVTRTKIDIIQKFFFFTSARSSYVISGIARVELHSSLFFSTLYLRAKFSDDQIAKISYLKKNEAKKAQSIIQGLLVAESEDVDISKVSVESMQAKVKKIGKPKEHESEQDLPG